MPNQDVGRVFDRAVKREHSDGGESRERAHDASGGESPCDKPSPQEHPEQGPAESCANRPQPEARDTERNESIEIEVVKKQRNEQR